MWHFILILFSGTTLVFEANFPFVWACSCFEKLELACVSCLLWPWYIVSYTQGEHISSFLWVFLSWWRPPNAERYVKWTQQSWSKALQDANVLLKAKKIKPCLEPEWFCHFCLITVFDNLLSVCTLNAKCFCCLLLFASDERTTCQVLCWRCSFVPFSCTFCVTYISVVLAR